MSQAIVNPDELRRFAQMLKKFNSGLAEQMIQRISAGEPAIPWADEASPLDIVVPLASIYQM